MRKGPNGPLSHWPMAGQLAKADSQEARHYAIMLIRLVRYTHRMSKRLQVILSDEEYEELRLVSSTEGMTVSEWVRGALRKMRRDRSLLAADGKLDAVRAAMRHDFPSGEITTMLGEIEAGYER